MAPMEYLEAWGTLIHEKNLKSKISCQTPFKVSDKIARSGSVCLIYGSGSVSVPKCHGSGTLHWQNQPKPVLAVVRLLSYCQVAEEGAVEPRLLIDAGRIQPKPVLVVVLTAFLLPGSRVGSSGATAAHRCGQNPAQTGSSCSIDCFLIAR
jgi:hypothetical protein